ncbi:DUF3630 family protein [Ferrimonas gelatinilytica]|uniref:DUF3630 domain-containing protein n=1 Tax=Ferrimonas gelatinilytica TaxID=1255257 RepID=A0ABP9RTL6_9GAMM
MEPVSRSLLLQLGPATLEAEHGRLIWPCPLDQESMPPLAAALAARLDCRLGTMVEGADRLYWPLEFEGVSLRLHYEALCESLWIQPERPDAESQAVVAFLATLERRS